MYEVEVKVRTPHDPIRERLDDCSASSLGRVVQTDVYYDAPHRNFAATDEALRIRTERPVDGEARTELTYKGPLVERESKTREEAETRVEDEDALAAILDGLGFEPAAEVRKERDRYRIDEYLVSLDSVDGLGQFVEVETETADDVASAREGVFDVLDDLGLDPDDQIRTSYLALLLADDSSS